MHRKNDSRVFVFGAGVSKAVAGAPVMSELFSKMKERYEQEKSLPDGLERNMRIREFKRIQEFIEKLERKAKKRFGEIEKKGGITIKRGIRENIEYLITLLDIHTEYGAMFEFEKLDADVSPFQIIPLEGVGRDEMAEVRSCLNTYLYLSLCNLNEQKPILKKFFEEQLRANDHLITFNYDVLIERTLLEEQKWSLGGGYVGVEQLKSGYNESALKSATGCSAYKILKLHGSITWVQEGPREIDINNPPVITLHKWDSSPFFPSLGRILNRRPEGARPTWLPPSYVKTFSNAPFLINIWREAQRILTQARRLVLLGYSFPEVDSQSQLLLASLPDGCSILIVDPDADAIKMRMDKLFQFPDISVKNMRFEEWVEQGCPGL